MKKFILLLLILTFQLSFSQKNCDYDTNITDSIGTLKILKEYLIFEKKFGNNESYIFFTLANSNGTPYLEMQYIQKNSSFIKAICFDENSKIFFQLENGKIITLIHTNDESCGTLLREEANNKNIRILAGNFLFLKGSFEELKSNPINLMRVKFGLETEDYIIKKVLESEFLKKQYKPESYFMEYLHCIE